MKKLSNKILVGLGLIVLVTYQNCAKTGFDQGTEQASQAPAVEEYVQMDVNSPLEMPKISSTIPDCLPSTKCRISFKLAKVNTMPISFHWKTDDEEGSKWKTGTLPVNVVWGVAGVHYVASEGEVLMQPGQTEKTIEIENINRTANGIRLKVLLSQCLMGEGSYRCQLFF